MTHAESRTITYAIVGSLAVHVVLALAFAVWIGVYSFHQLLTAPKVDLVDEPDVVLLFPEPPNLDAAAPPPLEPPPPPPQPKENAPYIRTTQNTSVAEAPKDAVFESDRNTVATTTAPTSSPDGLPMPSMKGRDEMTKELANRSFKQGELKDDSAPAAPPEKPQPPPTPPKVAETPPAPAPKPEPPAPLPPPPTPTPAPPPVAEKKPEEKKEPEAPAPPPPPQIAKKDDSPAEAMMKELDTKLAQEPPKPEPPKPEPEPPKTLPPAEPAKPPIMREAVEEVPIPKAIPVAKPVVNTPNPQENAFQPETHRSNTKGSISNVGEEDAVAAAATPIGRYQRQVNSIIEKRWHQLRLERVGAEEIGRMTLRFYISKSGKVEDLTILEDKASPLFADFTIEAILKADIPPLPADYVAIKDRLEITYDIVIHPK
jgi:hypothetical protein